MDIKYVMLSANKYVLCFHWRIFIGVEIQNQEIHICKPCLEWLGLGTMQTKRRDYS